MLRNGTLLSGGKDRRLISWDGSYQQIQTVEVGTTQQELCLFQNRKKRQCENVTGKKAGTFIFKKGLGTMIRLCAVSWISMHHWNFINDVCSALPFEVGSSFYPSFAFQPEETTEYYEYCTIS